MDPADSASHRREHEKRHIDKLLGKGYAKQHPELIAAYMQTAAIDFGTAIIARAIKSVLTALDNVGHTLDNLEERR